MKKLVCFMLLTLSAFFATSAIGAQNLIFNGDFEAGNIGFSTGYEYSPGYYGLHDEGLYAIGPDPQYSHPDFALFGDHTLGVDDINMMIVNGATSPDVNVWEQSLSIFPNTEYEFSFWLAECSSTPNEYQANLETFINGISIGKIEPNQPGQWIEFSKLWQSGANTTATIRIVDIETAVSTNDFAIDDISFVPEPATLFLFAYAGLLLRKRK
jgi:hypothetical protein